jgi:DedD protein
MKLPGRTQSNDKRRGADSGRGSAQSEEALRVRARRRLIGAVALVLTGVVVFPIIFETQPKPVASNMNLVIPSATQAGALALPRAVSSAAHPFASAPPAAASQPPVVHAASQPAQPRPAAKAVASAPATPATPAPQAPLKAPAAAPAQSAAAVPNAAGARQALAALEGKQPDQISPAQLAAAAHAAPASAPAAARFVVQAGAFADAQAAHLARQKIEHAGLRSYTQVVQTKGGARIRVRVGPFSDRAQAEQAGARIRALGLSANVLGL